MPFGDDVRWSWPVGGGLIAASLVVAMPFVSTRVAQHEDINRIYAGTGDLASRYWSDEANTFLLVNGPAYLAPADPTFLLGAEGATFLPDFINLGDWLRLNRYIGAGQADNRRAGDIIPASDDIFAVTHPALDRTTVNEYAQVAVVVRSHDDVNVILAGRQGFDAPAVDVPAGDFGNGVILERGILTQDRLPGMQAYRLELVWRVDETPPAHATVFAHLICDSQLVAQADGPPLGRVYPFSLWAAGERWHDFRYMSAASHEQSCLRAFVGLYDPATGDRLPVRTPSGDSADGVWIDLATDD